MRRLKAKVTQSKAWSGRPVARAAAGVPPVLLLVGDHLAGVDDLAQPFWRKEAIRLMWRWNHRQQLRLGDNRDAGVRCVLVAGAAQV